MFDVLVESTSRRGTARTWALFAASSMTWLLIFAAVAVAGIVTYDAKLDADFDSLGLVAWAPAPPPPPPSGVTSRRPPVDNSFHALREQPIAIRPPSPTPPRMVGASTVGADIGGSSNGQDTGDPFGTGNVPQGFGSTPIVVPTPDPPADPPRAVVEPVVPRRPVSRVLNGIVRKRVEPKYPAIARSASVSGDVVVEVTVSETGDVISARVVSGHPLLRDAALQAARGWSFTPTLLSGTPVKVIGTITFAFKL